MIISLKENQRRSNQSEGDWEPTEGDGRRTEEMHGRRTERDR